MFREIWRDIQYQIRVGNFWTRIIMICAVVFLLLNILKSYYTFSNGGNASSTYQFILNKLSLSSVLIDNLYFPWVWFTHIFVHEGFFHLLWNMIFLYWVSQIVEDLIGRHHAKYIFFEGAVVGGLFFLLSTLLLPWYAHQYTSIAYGASAAVTALLFAAATIAPNYEIRLILIGGVSLKYIALIVLILDLLFAFQNTNSGGHMAHIGGAVWGWAYILLLRKGIKMNFLEKNLSERKEKKSAVIRSLPKREDKAIAAIQSNVDEELNRILDKIKSSGLTSLTDTERKFLDNFN